MRAVEHVHREVGVLRRDAHRRLDPEHVALEPALAQQHAHLARGLEHLERLRAWPAPAWSGRVTSSTPSMRPMPAHLADQRVALLQPAQSLQQAGAHLPRVLLQAVLVDHVEHRQPGRHRHRVAAEGVEVDPAGERLGDLPPGGDRGQRHAVADALGHGDDVGYHAVVLEAPVVLAGSAEAGLHFVGNAEPAVLPRRCVCLAEIVRCAPGDPADPLDRLGDEGGDLARASSSGSARRMSAALCEAISSGVPRERTAIADRGRARGARPAGPGTGILPGVVRGQADAELGEPP